MKKIFENAVWWSGVIAVGLILGISLQFVKAWTEPTVAPPGGNVGAPINTSALYQIKTGILGVAGLVTNAFQLTTGAGAGKVLTSDVNGIGSWQTGGGSGCGSIPVYQGPAGCNNALFTTTTCSTSLCADGLIFGDGGGIVGNSRSFYSCNGWCSMHGPLSPETCGTTLVGNLCAEMPD